MSRRSTRATSPTPDELDTLAQTRVALADALDAMPGEIVEIITLAQHDGRPLMRDLETYAGGLLQRLKAATAPARSRRQPMATPSPLTHGPRSGTVAMPTGAASEPQAPSESGTYDSRDRTPSIVTPQKTLGSPGRFGLLRRGRPSLYTGMRRNSW